MLYITCVDVKNTTASIRMVPRMTVMFTGSGERGVRLGWCSEFLVFKCFVCCSVKLEKCSLVSEFRAGKEAILKKFCSVGETMCLHCAECLL